jgi:uncharacterized membrane protein SirB2
MKIKWFKRWEWLRRPVWWPCLTIILAVLNFCVRVFWAIDRRSHSEIDTLFGVVPFVASSFLLLEGIINQAGHETK